MAGSAALGCWFSRALSLSSAAVLSACSWANGRLMRGRAWPCLPGRQGRLPAPGPGRPAGLGVQARAGWPSARHRRLNEGDGVAGVSLVAVVLLWVREGGPTVRRFTLAALGVVAVCIGPFIVGHPKAI